MKVACSPRVVVPLVLGIGIIAVLLGYANVDQVLQAASAFQPHYFLLILLLTLAYEVLRALQWLLFLRVLNHRKAWRGGLMSFMGGEMAKALPGGQYFQTYLLRQAHGVPVARSAAATTIIIWLEVATCLVAVLILGVGSWTWVRPAAAALLVGIALLAVVVKRRPLSSRFLMASRRRPRLRPVSAWYAGFIGSADALLCLRALVPAAVLSAAYIAVAALALWAIAAGLGLHGLGFTQALVVYAFALGAGLIIPVPIDLGLTELSGLAALMAFGVPRADALTVMLLQRLVSSTLTGGISLVGLAVLRRHVAAALQTRCGPTTSRIRPVARRAALRDTASARRAVCGE
jgi:uncharacterized protein (TIRG00374 family)